MTGHIPECPMTTEDAVCCSLTCICDALRACENRVRSEAYWNYPSIRGDQPPVFKDLGNPFDVARVAYDKGQRDALAQAVQRYEEATKGGDDCGCESCLAYSERIIAAIKGDQP